MSKKWFKKVKSVRSFHRSSPIEMYYFNPVLYRSVECSDESRGFSSATLALYRHTVNKLRETRTIDKVEDTHPPPMG